MKKSPGSKRPVVKTKKQLLVKDLTTLFDELDEPGLEFLKHQAEVLLHNARIEEVRKKAAQFAEGLPGDEHQKTNGAPHPQVNRDVRIEKTDHNFFNVFVGRNRIFFNRDEMKMLTKICHASASVSEATTRLYRWFERERKDFLNDTGIERAGHPALAELYEIIIHTYKVKEH